MSRRKEQLSIMGVGNDVGITLQVHFVTTEFMLYWVLVGQQVRQQQKPSHHCKLMAIDFCIRAHSDELCLHPIGGTT